MNSPPAATNLMRRLPLIAMMIIVTLFASLFLNFYSPAFYGLTDEHAYLTSAKTLAENHTLARSHDSPLEFFGENFVAKRPLDAPPWKTLFAKHPPATAVFFALAYMIAGPDGPFWVNLIFCILAIIGTYLMGRDLVDRFVGIIAAAALAICPLTLLFAIHPMSHAGELAASVFACWLLIRARKSMRPWLLACLGASLGLAASIRYTSLLLALPVAAGLIGPLWQLEMRKRIVAAGAFLLGMMLVLAPTLAYHAAAFGSPLRTGYAFTNESTAFGYTFFTQHAAPVAGAFVFSPYGLPIFFPLLIPALVVVFRSKRDAAILLALWTIPPILLYTSYYWMPDSNAWLYIRFFLPTFPALIIATLAGLTILLPMRPIIRIVISVVALAHGLFWFSPNVQNTFAIQRDTAAMAREFAAAVNEKLPEGAILIADPPAHYYLDYATRCKIVDAALFFPGKSNENRIGPMLTDPELLVPPTPNPPGPSMLYARTKGGTAALFCQDSHLAIWNETLSPLFQLTVIKKLPLGWTLVQLTPNKM